MQEKVALFVLEAEPGALRPLRELFGTPLLESALEWSVSIAEQVTESTPIPVKGFGTIEAKWRTLAEELAYGTLTPKDFADQWFSEAEFSTQ